MERAAPHASSSGHARKVRDSAVQAVSAVTAAAPRPRPPSQECCPGQPQHAASCFPPPTTRGTEDTAIWSGTPRTPVVTPNTDPRGCWRRRREGRTHGATCAPPGVPAMCARLRRNVSTGAASLHAPHIRPPVQAMPKSSPWPHHPQRGQGARPLAARPEGGLGLPRPRRGGENPRLSPTDSQPRSPRPPALGAARAAQRERF